MPTIDQVLEPKLIAYLIENGYKVEKDNKVNHDIVVDGKTIECKYFANTYNDIYVELFQCADTANCPDCNSYYTQDAVLYGWGHRMGYCHADKLCMVHSKDYEITQISVLPRKKFLDWVWDVYMKNNTRQNTIFSWSGRHRTIGIAIPFYMIPADLIKTKVI